MPQKEADLADRISRAVTDTFHSLSLKSGKPIVRSNGVHEWTVLAGIVALCENKILPLTLATGVKALPDKSRAYSNGLLVHDMHAEVLAIRLFNWFLLDEAVRMHNEQYQSEVVEKADKDGHFRIKKDIALALYISEPPCGDASMSHLSQDKEPWEEGPRKRQKTDLLRGRDHFHKLGLVRTKPGRLDSAITLSKSCSDKLCLRQVLGLTNAIASTLFPENAFLDYLVLKEEKLHEEDLKRCFEDRIAIPGVKNMRYLGYREDQFEYHKPDDTHKGPVPSPLSLLHVPGRLTEVLNNGVKNGSFVKNRVPRKGGESLICNQQLWKKGRVLVERASSQKGLPEDRNGENALFVPPSYVHFKQLDRERVAVKQRAISHLSNWNPTAPDDFSLA